MTLPVLDHPGALWFQKNQSVVYAGVALLLCFLTFQFNFYNQYQKLQQAKAQYHAQEQELEILQRRKRAAEKKRKELSERLVQVQTLLFSPAEALKFSNQVLPQLIQDSGCRVDTIQRKPQQQVNDALYQMFLDVRLLGSTKQIATLFAKIKALPQRVSYKDLSIDPAKDSKQMLMVTLVLFYAI